MNEAITALLTKAGCDKFGFADLRGLNAETRQNFPFAVVLGQFYSREAVRQLAAGNPALYNGELDELNAKLDDMAESVEKRLVTEGYKALARVRSSIAYADYYRSVLPHKTVATLAGFGWVGKCALLITREAGSALRLSAVLTDAPLTCDTPVSVSACPDQCTACADACPGGAVKDVKWYAGLDRDALYDARACRTAARQRAKATLGVDETVCGLCIASCPFTRRAYNL